MEYYKVVQGDGCMVNGDQGVQEPTTELIENIELRPNGPVVAVTIPMCQWHTVYALESGTCILEMKNGGYRPLGEDEILTKRDAFEAIEQK